MTYVDAFHLRDDEQNIDKVVVVENVNGERVYREFPTDYVFYYEHSSGSYTSIYDDKCEKFHTNSSKKFNAALKKKRTEGKVFESDIKPVFRLLADKYSNADVPSLNIGFFDIEADFHPVKGYAPTSDPFNAITAITIYLSHLKTNYTLALCPPTLSFEDAQKIGRKFDNTVIFDSEIEMLELFLDVVEPVDVLTGWNSVAYDVPYLVNRIERVMGRNATARLCLWNQFPRAKETHDKFGRTVNTYDLAGRVHLDYMDLYKKHNQQQQQSYALNAIGESEVGEIKVPYEGTLDDLYKKDFLKFIEYSRQDVMLLVKIDAKKLFISLANQIAHANCVLLSTTMGTVTLIEQAVINEMHQRGYVVPDRRPKNDDDGEQAPIVGAYVADPKAGLHYQIGCVDINSLYPSTIRALNMSPETIYGQIRMHLTTKLVDDRIASGIGRAEAWEGIFQILEMDEFHNRSEMMLEIDFEDGTFAKMTAAELHDLIFEENSNLCISANGTIFRTDKEGIIPALFAKWYAERKVMQAKQREYAEEKNGLEISEELAKLLE